MPDRIRGGGDDGLNRTNLQAVWRVAGDLGLEKPSLKWQILLIRISPLRTLRLRVMHLFGRAHHQEAKRQQRGRQGPNRCTHGSYNCIFVDMNKLLNGVDSGMAVRYPASPGSECGRGWLEHT